MISVLLKYRVTFFSILFCLLLVSLFTIAPHVLSNHYFINEKNSSLDSVAKTIEIVEEKLPSYVETPDSVRGIYMTSWVAGTPSLRNKLVSLIDETELNTVVIDIKDYSGKIIFPIDNEKLRQYGSEEIRVADMKDFIEELHGKNIYVIGRVAVFQDAYFVKYRPELAVKNSNGDKIWKDRKGISWIDPGSTEYWDYIVLLVDESRKIGFDEINFDYIRFPSDGNMKDISYPWSSSTPKTITIKIFLCILI